MKRSLKISSVILCTALLVSCSPAQEEVHSEVTSDTTSQSTSDATSETAETVSTTTTDIGLQLDLITDSYDYLYEDFDLTCYSPEESRLPASFAITDLNHNGRLEIILSSCVGTGCYSNSQFYEVTEDYSSLQRLDINGETVTDDIGDLMIPRDGDQITTYNCYMLDGEYYYEIADYASDGWTKKHHFFYSYSFGTEVSREYIGGCAVNVDTEADNTINVWLSNASREFFEDDVSYSDYMNSYWSGYEQLSPCEVKWVLFNDEDSFADLVTESYYAFNPESERTVENTYDYREYFSGFYGDDYEFVIQSI